MQSPTETRSPKSSSKTSKPEQSVLMPAKLFPQIQWCTIGPPDFARWAENELGGTTRWQQNL
jgi:hypothetical protein